MDLNQAPQNAGDNFLRETYKSQFHGDYALWIQQPNKTLILDNLSGRAGLVDFILAAKESFERIIITLPSIVFHALFRDEARLAPFEELEIEDLSQAQQEILIRKRLAVSSENLNLTDADVDRVEDRVNSIIIDNRVVPRYPFFVLCILQTYEAYMPAGMAITSYGHCYYALIVASLIRAGISRQDSDINACFNFAEQLAFETYQHTLRKASAQLDLDDFTTRYKREYVIPNASINRLKHEEFGLINPDGQFRTPYMYHFFLGRVLSRGRPVDREIIQHMCDATHVSANYLTLLFVIHHTSDPDILDDILVRTMITVEDVPAASLSSAETRRFGSIVFSLPKNLMLARSVESERRLEREARDLAADALKDTEGYDDEGSYDDGSELQEAVNGVYRVLKNNQIMGQVLRNKFGSLTRQKIEEIIDIVMDGGLRLVNVFLRNEDEIAEMAHYIETQNPDYDIEKIKRDLGVFALVWTMLNVEQVVKAINVPEIGASVQKAAERGGTPAHDIIGYFSVLDAAPRLTKEERSELDRLWKKHKDPFVRGVISIRTLHYMNTHRSRADVEQAVCALLGIKYVQRLVEPNR